MIYIRPEDTKTLGPYNGDYSNGTIDDSSITVQGGDCVVSNVVVVLNAAPIADTLTFDVTPKSNAVPGVRDVRIAYSDNNATPVIKKDVLTVLRIGCLGSRLHFHVAGRPLGPAPYTEWPAGCPVEDHTAPSKMFLPTLIPWDLPRIYMWDCSDDRNSNPTFRWPRFDYTDPTTGPDLNNTLPTGREAQALYGYLNNAIEDYNPEVAAWNQPSGAAYAAAPDEFVVQSGAIVNEQKWTGFPDPNTPIENLANVPAEAFHRKPHAYLSSPDYFWSRDKIKTNRTWLTSHGGGIVGQAGLCGIPMWARGTNSSTFDSNYEKPFKQMREYEFSDNGSGSQKLAYNPASDTANYALAKGIMLLSIEPIECVLPGPRTSFPNKTATDYKTSSTHRRRKHDGRYKRGKDTWESMIRIYYQDLWAFSDYYNGGTGSVTAGDHKMSEPILLAEAHCPRMDLTWDYEEWENRNQPVPNNTSGDGQDYFYPTLTFESQPFKWKRILTDPDQETVGDSDINGVTGRYLNTTDILEASRRFLREFDGYLCKLVIQDSVWNPVTDPTNAHYQAFFAAPRAYGARIRDREGTFVGMSGYLEVVKDASD